MTREWSAPESAKLGDIIAVIAGADNRVDEDYAPAVKKNQPQL